MSKQIGVESPRQADTQELRNKITPAMLLAGSNAAGDTAGASPAYQAEAVYLAMVQVQADSKARGDG